MKKIHISQVDTVFVNGSYPIEFLFYYNYPIKTSTLRKALKKISTNFWPVFGTYDNGLISSSEYDEDKFISETIYNEDFVADKDEMQIWEKYSSLNPQKMQGLFFLSILQFNNGTVLIPKMNHLVGDGYSYFYLLSLLVAFSKSSSIPLKKYLIRLLASPHHKRTALKPFHFNKTKIEEPLAHQNWTIQTEQILRSDVLQDIENIKLKYAVDVSTNDVLSAMVFKKTFEKQKSFMDNQFTLSIPMDVRRFVKELGASFFGNGLMFHNLSLDISELEKITTSELTVKLRESMPVINKENHLKYLNDLDLKVSRSSVHSLKPYDPDRGCLVTNLSRMPMDKLNFGSGTPAFNFPLTIGRNGAAILANKESFLLRIVY